MRNTPLQVDMLTFTGSKAPARIGPQGECRGRTVSTHETSPFSAGGVSPSSASSRAARPQWALGSWGCDDRRSLVLTFLLLDLLPPVDPLQPAVVIAAR